MSREFEVKRRDYEEKEGENQDVPGATDRGVNTKVRCNY